MWFDHWGWGYGPMGWGMGLSMLVFWGVAIAALVLVVRSLDTGRGTEPPPARGPSAREILDQRYALGEIDRAEYEQKRQDLDRP